MHSYKLFFIFLFPFFIHAEDSCPEKMKLGQMLMVSPPKGKMSELASFQKKKKDYGIGGVILMKHNLGTLKKPNDILAYTNFMQEGADTPLFVSVDQEGGVVQRLNEDRGFIDLPNLKQVGKAGNSELAYDFGRFTGAELSAVGVNWNFAPVLDVASNPDNPVITRLNRSLSENPEVVSLLGSDIISGMQSSGMVLATAKHFPGHGSTGGDSHLNEVTNTRSIFDLYFDVAPFIEAINSDVASIMVGHITTPFIPMSCNGPSSLSPFFIQGVLREQLGFEGLVITDDLAMGAITQHYPLEEAAEKAILAGNDVLIITSQDWEKVFERVCKTLKEDSEVAAQLKIRINESYERILGMKKKYQILDFKPLPPVEGPISPKLHKEIIDKYITNIE